MGVRRVGGKTGIFPAGNWNKEQIIPENTKAAQF